MPVIEISLDWNIKKRSVNHVKEKVSTHFSVEKVFMKIVYHYIRSEYEFRKCFVMGKT